uniref:Uncharacterized protein n=1 Tax=Tremella fuciformis TaxID=64657 RepID=A0A2H4QBR4_9TREE|nr:hypothetical protein [Tremella fuciformis]
MTAFWWYESPIELQAYLSETRCLIECSTIDLEEIKVSFNPVSPIGGIIYSAKYWRANEASSSVQSLIRWLYMLLRTNWASETLSVIAQGILLSHNTGRNNVVRRLWRISLLVAPFR